MAGNATYALAFVAYTIILASYLMQAPALSRESHSYLGGTALLALGYGLLCYDALQRARGVSRPEGLRNHALVGAYAALAVFFCVTLFADKVMTPRAQGYDYVGLAGAVAMLAALGTGSDLAKTGATLLLTVYYALGAWHYTGHLDHGAPAWGQLVGRALAATSGVGRLAAAAAPRPAYEPGKDKHA